MPRHTPLSVTFRLDLDHRAIEQGLTIDPPISGTVKWQGRTLVFTPDRGWQPDQTYRITVKYRDQILPPSWTFTTLPLVKLISPGQHEQRQLELIRSRSHLAKPWIMPASKQRSRSFRRRAAHFSGRATP